MRASSRLLTLAAIVAGLAIPCARAHGDGPEFPMSPSRLALRDSAKAAKRRIAFAGRWGGDLGDMDPTFEPSTLRIYGAPGEGDSGLIHLGQNWSRLPKGKGFRYADPTGSSGGIKTILLKTGRKGRLQIKGGSERWTFDLSRKPTSLIVTLAVGEATWCAELAKVKGRGAKVVGRSSGTLERCPCEAFDSTWAAIQSTIFERQGCTQAACHGSPAGAASAGGLDLQPAVAYQNLVDVFSERGQMSRVERGSSQDSFLYRKLQMTADELAANGWGARMPQGLAPLGVEEIEALRLWIQSGANPTGVVSGTELLLKSCLPEPEPPRIEPPAPPAPGTGVQFHAPPWTIPANDEDEVCYATWFDVTDALPEWAKVPCPDFWGGPGETCYYYDKDELTQEPNSHHSIIHLYRGEYDVTDPGFAFQCHGGPTAGQPCDPRIGDVCGDGGTCHGAVKSSLACLTYGPPDFSRGLGAATGAGSDNAPSVGGSQQPFLRNEFPDGVFRVFPAKGVFVWNSHAFNVFDEPTSNQQWWNLYFTGQNPADDLKYFMNGIFDARDIFVQDVPPFEQDEYCRTITFGIGTRLAQLSSHTHEFGRLFRIWGPGVAEPCRSQTEGDACAAEPGPPIFVTTEYNDPTVLRYPEPVALDDPDPAARRYKFCALYDNGYTDPAAVKRNSESPLPPTFGALAPGGPCLVNGLVKRDSGIACLAGPNKGQACGAGSAATGFAPDDRRCDGPGYTAPAGTCDACPVVGGVTTKDEMFILLGDYYCVDAELGCDPATQHCCREGYLNEKD